MEKEQVIEKLEEVFEVACEQFIKSEGYSDTIRLIEIKELGQTIINARTNVGQEVARAKDFIISNMHNYLVNHDLKPVVKGSD